MKQSPNKIALASNMIGTAFRKVIHNIQKNSPKKWQQIFIS